MMTPIDPIIGSLLQTPQVQRLQSTERASAIRRQQEVRKNAGATRDDQFEHQVESSEEVAAIHDETPEHPDQKRRRQSGKHPAQDAEQEVLPSIDVTA